MSFTEHITAHLPPFSPGTRILVSYSGGPDSSALLHWLTCSSLKLRVGAFYLDHGLRSEEELGEELRIVRENCRAWKVSLFVEQIPPGELEEEAREKGLSLEEAARARRYPLLEKYGEEFGASYLAVGHNKDDQMETLVMRFFQGAGYGGLGGIPRQRGKIIRPLFGCTKKEIREYLDEQGIFFSSDSSNQSNRFLRNNIRNRLLPLVEEIFPGYRESLTLFSEKMADMKVFVEDTLEAQVHLVPREEGFEMSYSRYCALPATLKSALIYRAYQLLRADENPPPLPYRFIRPALKNPGDILLRGKGMVIFRRGEMLFFQRDIVYNRKKGYLLVAEKCRSWQCLISNLFFLIDSQPEPHNNINGDVVLNPDRIKYPLIIRSRRRGDRVRQISFSRSIKRIFSDWKVPENQKERIPVVEDRTGVIALVGRPFGFRNLVASQHEGYNRESGEKNKKLYLKFEIMEN